MSPSASFFSQMLSKLIPVEENAKGDFELRSGKKALIDRFGGILSVLYEDSNRNLFVLNAGGETRPSALGRVFELNPPLWADDSTAALFERLLRMEFPPDSTLAATLYASPSIEETLNDYMTSRDASKMHVSAEAAQILQAAAQARTHMFRQLAQGTGAFSSRFCARHFRIWLSLTSQIGERDVLNPKSDAFTAFLRTGDAIASSLASAGLLSGIWDGKTYVKTLRELLNPQLARIGLGKTDIFDSDRPLRDAVVDHSTVIDVSRNGIDFASLGSVKAPRVRAAALGVSGYPAETTINAMSGLIGAGLRSQTAILDPYLVTAVAEPTSRSDDRTGTAVKLARVKQLEQTEIGVFLTDLRQRARDLEIASEACRNGEGLCRLTHEVVVFSREECASGAEEAAKAILSEAGLEGELDVGLQMMGLLLSLPMEAGVSLMQDARTARHTSTKTRRAAAHMLPLLGEYRSTLARPGERRPMPMVLLAARSGELIGIDLFANRNGNNNAIVVANSGAGKSVFVEDIVMAMLGTGGRVWVFDIGKSYQHCADLVHGQWIEFDERGGALP